MQNAPLQFPKKAVATTKDRNFSVLHHSILYTPPDELDLRVTNFHRAYGKKNTKYAEKKKGVKQKTGIFPDMSDVVWCVCVFLFFQAGLKHSDHYVNRFLEHSNLFPVQDAVLQLSSYTSS